MKTYVPPPDKSVTIRALLLAAVSEGRSRVENPLASEDTGAAVRCLRALGVKLRRSGNALLVEGRGLRGLKRPAGPLDAGESAALARLLAGLLAGQSFPSKISGRGSLLKRPMKDTLAGLARLGAGISSKNGALPLSIRPARLKGGRVNGITSAQVKSALLLAGLYASGPTETREKAPTRDHTERLLALLGARLTRKGSAVRLEPGRLTARPVTVPGDISSAAPFIAAALLSGSSLRITGCGLNPLRLGFVAALRRMGARIELKASPVFPEPFGELLVLPSRLRAVKVAPAEVPSLVDEVPLLAVLAASAKGVTEIKGIDCLRAKESDRVAATLALLASLGAGASYRRGALLIEGGGPFSAASPVDTFGDHRIAMAAAAASAACPGLEIKDPGCVAKSYPGFWKDFRKVFSTSRRT